MSNVDDKTTGSGSGRLIAGIAIGCGCSLLMAVVLIVVLAGFYFSTVSVKLSPEHFASEHTIPAPSEYRFRDLFHAAAHGSVDDVQFFIEQGADVNERNDKKRASGISVTNSQGVSIVPNINDTPLHCAVRLNQDIEVVKYLIEKGANVNAQDDNGKTPFDVADTDEKKTILREAGGKTEYELSGTIL